MSLARILGKPRGRPTFVTDDRWVLPSCLTGWEFEYEGVTNRDLPNHTYADLWKYHEEGSLKDNGAEYVFAVPLFGADSWNALAWLTSYAAEQKWKCTKRTGIHVHLNVGDLEVPQLAGMCMLYAALEPLLYHWIGDGRDASHFCAPLYTADDALYDVCMIVRSAMLDDKAGSSTALAMAERFQRYAGYNLQALHKFGTVEFRQLQTTHDFNRIVQWGNIIMSLKAAAYKLPQSDGAVLRMIEGMQIEDVLNYVFPLPLANVLYTKDSDRQFRNIGLPSAWDIAVHGCSDRVDWVRKIHPKGENKVFKKWVSSGQNETKQKSRKTNDEEFLEFNTPAARFEDPDDHAEVRQNPVDAQVIGFQGDGQAAINEMLNIPLPDVDPWAADPEHRQRDALQRLRQQFNQPLPPVRIVRPPQHPVIPAPPRRRP